MDGVFEISCGALILAGLLTRLTVIPVIVDTAGTRLADLQVAVDLPPECSDQRSLWPLQVTFRCSKTAPPGTH
ncbi:DoxX family protein [Rhodococcus olei]|uniref:DoxX family protein n=1 Tax=Rhodococcus olei TaxID=2161675 RepID=UPI0031E7F560